MINTFSIFFHELNIPVLIAWAYDNVTIKKSYLAFRYIRLDKIYLLRLPDLFVQKCLLNLKDIFYI